MDLRNDSIVIENLRRIHKEPVTTEKGENMAKHIGAYAFLECSSKTREGVQEVFYTAAKAALINSKSKYSPRHSKYEKNKNCRFI